MVRNASSGSLRRYMTMTTRTTTAGEMGRRRWRRRNTPTTWTLLRSPTLPSSWLPYFVVVALFLAISTTMTTKETSRYATFVSATGTTNCKTLKYSESPWAYQNDDAEELGGVENIDKIISFQVKTTTNVVPFKSVLYSLIIKYRLYPNDEGGIVEKEFTIGGFSTATTEEVSVDLEDLEYLTGVYALRTEDDALEETYINHIAFQTSTRFFGPYGSDLEQPANLVYEKDRAVIIAFKSTLGTQVVENLAVHYEKDRVLWYHVSSVELTESFPYILYDEEDFDAPNSIVTVDNIEGTGMVQDTQSFTEIISSNETTNITMSTKDDADLDVEFVAGDFGKVLLSVEIVDRSDNTTSTTIDIHVGLLFDQTFEEWKFVEVSETYQMTVDVQAPPNYKVTRRAIYRAVEYQYDWVGQVKCVYAYNAAEPEYMGGNITGIVAGIRPLKSAEILTDDERGPTSMPTRAPTRVPTRAPSGAHDTYYHGSRRTGEGDGTVVRTFRSAIVSIGMSLVILVGTVLMFH